MPGETATAPARAGLRGARDICTVPRLTTAGRTRSATCTNAVCRASAALTGVDDGGVTELEDLVHNAWTSNPTPRHRTSVAARKPARALRGVMARQQSVGLGRVRILRIVT